jgi:hypothetical protein
VRAANAHADVAGGHASFDLAAYFRGLSELLLVAKQAQVLLHAQQHFQSTALEHAAAQTLVNAFQPRGTVSGQTHVANGWAELTTCSRRTPIRRRPPKVPGQLYPITHNASATAASAAQPPRTLAIFLSWRFE